MKKLILYPAFFLCALLCFCIIPAVTSLKIHDFEGKCAMCHSNMPDGANTANLIFTDEEEKP